MAIRRHIWLVDRQNEGLFTAAKHGARAIHDLAAAGGVPPDPPTPTRPPCRRDSPVVVLTPSYFKGTNSQIQELYYILELLKNFF